MPNLHKRILLRKGTNLKASDFPGGWTEILAFNISLVLLYSMTTQELIETLEKYK